MRTRTFVYLAALFLLPFTVWALPASQTSNFVLDSPSNIPGASLKPGSYSIRVVNRLSDRVILRVNSTAGDVNSLFIGVEKNKIERPVKSGPVVWENSANGTNHLKGWYFPGAASVIEFVYPKADAVAIASANPATVPAVDPASEGKVADSALSQDDLQLLTLWVLSLQQVGPGVPSPGIKAVRYQMSANATPKPIIKALPHTASLMPWVWLSALCSLLVALSIRMTMRAMHGPQVLTHQE
jgi:hypothetical protein